MSKKAMDSKQTNTKSGIDTKTSRRKVLRNTLIGGAVISTSAVPKKWSKPVLDSVLLPTHAATTDDLSTLGVGAPTPPPTTVAATTPASTTPQPTTTPNKKMTSNIVFDHLDYDVA